MITTLVGEYIVLLHNWIYLQLLLMQNCVSSVEFRSVSAHRRNRRGVKLWYVGTWYAFGFVKHRWLYISVRPILLNLRFIAFITIYRFVVFSNFSTLCQDKGLVLAWCCISQLFDFIVFGRNWVIVLGPSRFQTSKQFIDKFDVNFPCRYNRLDCISICHHYRLHMRVISAACLEPLSRFTSIWLMLPKAWVVELCIR